MGSNNTKLNDRTLWYDGDSSIDADSIIKMIQHEDTRGLFVNMVTDEIEKFNRYVEPDQRLTVKQHCRMLEFGWNIPDEYKELDVVEYVILKQIKLFEEEGKYTVEYDVYRETRYQRLVDELLLYDDLGLFDVLRALIYIINTLQTNKAVWGVGRGSAVSSYVLYVIGVHDVDSVLYGLEVTDFLRR